LYAARAQGGLCRMVRYRDWFMAAARSRYGRVALPRALRALRA